MIALKNFKHKLFPRPKQQSIPHEGLNRQLLEVHTPQSSLASRSLLSGGGYKYDGKALRERTNGEENTYNTHSSFNYFDTKKSTINLSKENNANLSSMQAEKKALDNKDSSFHKEIFQVKRPSSLSRKEFTGNDENQISGSYHEYLQHSHIVKPKSMDYKGGDFMKFNVKGANK